MAMGLTAVAHAQSQQTYDPTPTNLVIRVGGGFALDSNLKDYSSTFFGGGLDFGFGKGLFPNAETYFSADALWGSRKSTNDSFFPFAVNQRFYLNNQVNASNANGDKRAYGFFGLGGTYYQVGGADLRPSLRGGFGLDLTENIIFEATAFFSAKSKNDVNANILGLYLGYRFR